MHSLETGIIVSIASFFFFSFLTFTFLREGNISKDIAVKIEQEKKNYQLGDDKEYNPERSFNIVNIIEEGVYDRNNEE